MQQKAGTVLFRRQRFSIVLIVVSLVVTGLVSLPKNGWFGFPRLFGGNRAAGNPVPDSGPSPKRPPFVVGTPESLAGKPVPPELTPIPGWFGQTDESSRGKARSADLAGRLVGGLLPDANTEGGVPVGFVSSSVVVSGPSGSSADPVVVGAEAPDRAKRGKAKKPRPDKPGANPLVVPIDKDVSNPVAPSTAASTTLTVTSSLPLSTTSTVVSTVAAPPSTVPPTSPVPLTSTLPTTLVPVVSTVPSTVVPLTVTSSSSSSSSLAVTSQTSSTASAGRAAVLTTVAASVEALQLTTVAGSIGASVGVAAATGVVTTVGVNSVATTSSTGPASSNAAGTTRPVTTVPSPVSVTNLTTLAATVAPAPSSLTTVASTVAASSSTTSTSTTSSTTTSTTKVVGPLLPPRRVAGNWVSGKLGPVVPPPVANPKMTNKESTFGGPVVSAEPLVGSGTELSAHAIGFQVGAAMIGAAVVPGTLGVMAGLGGLEAVPVGTVVLFAILSLLHEGLIRLPDVGTDPN